MTTNPDKRQRPMTAVEALDCSFWWNTTVSEEAQKVIRFAYLHRDYARDRDDAYWLALLVEEVGELASSLAGRHEDAPEVELHQIASICINWLDMRDQRQAAPQEEK